MTNLHFPPRSQQSCSNCYFARGAGATRVLLLCRRHAPAATATEQEGAARWPWVDQSDWCGEWAYSPQEI